MNLRNLRFLGLAFVLGVAFSPAYGGTAHGTVKNGTTGQPAAGIEVILIQLQGGMQPVLTTKTDAQGQFSFDFPAIGTQPMLLRAVYRGVLFHEPLPPGQNDINVEVYDPSQDPKTINVATHFVIFQPNGSSLQVGEEYAIKNDSQPPLAYFRSNGDFDFVLPPGATLKQTAAQGPSGMPVIQEPIDKGKNHYSVAYAFRPGDNGVRFSYELPYAADTATVKLPTVYPGARLVLVAPPSVQVIADGLQPSGQEQGMNLYSRDNLAPNSTLTVNVSGTAPPPNESGGDPGQAGGQGTDASSAATIQVAPGRLDVLKWPLVGGFLCVFVLLAIFLSRKQVTATVSVPAANYPAPTAASAPTRASEPAPKKPIPAAAAPVAAERPAPAPRPAVAPSTTMAAMDAAVGTSLDALKETLFKLELRRQAGTISDEEYNRERARAEKVLRDLVRG